ncbi:MAG TPA: hypothetical protein VK142_05135 [Bacillota bacterium]|nr:hypothetical protein [Bacillota bacterium]
MTIYKGKAHNMGKLAIFLSRLNSEKQSHIGYCGTNSDEIQQTLREDFLEENDELSFMIAFNEKNEIIAAIGLDVDDDIAEVWGPFQISDEVKGNILWEELLKEYPQIHTFHFFINEVNSRQLAFAESIGAGYTGKHSILEITTDSVTPLSHEHSTPYSEESFEAFQKLHHETFPGTYYDAGTIVERLKRGHTLKLLKAGDHHL